MKNFKIGTKLLLSILVLTIVSCSKDEVIAEKQIEVKNLMTINVDGVKYRSINENFAGNENCGNLHVSTAYYEKNNIDFRLTISLSENGQLNYVRYGENKLPIQGVTVMKQFFTPNFNPLRTFNISEFSYNSATRDLSFRFDGTVFFEGDNSKVRNLSGKIDIKSFRTIECGIVKTGISFISPNFTIYDTNSNRTRFANNTQRHRYFLNNGHIIDINVEQDFWDLQLGEILFTQSSTQNKVSIIKQLDNIIANQTASMNDHQWLNYGTEGKIIIEKKEIINGTKKISGTINLNMFDNGQLVRSLNGIKFSTGSFND